MKRNLDILVAVGIFICSTAVSFFSFNQVHEVEKPTSVPFQEIIEGSSRYQVLNKDLCVGHFEFELNKETLYLLTGKGLLQVKLPQKDLKVSIGAQWTFNPLGQLINSQTTLSSPDFSLSLSSENINPITLHLKASSGGPTYKRTLSVPGPVLLSQNPSGRSYRIDYFALEQASISRFMSVSSTLSKPLRIVPAELSPHPCDRENLASFDLREPVANLIDTLGSLHSAFRPFNRRPHSD